MRIVLQRVTEARVEVEGRIAGSIGPGLAVLLGIAKNDSEADADYLAAKMLALRMFNDEHGKMNRSVLETNGCLLVVSQFTLLGDCRKGRRPSFDGAAPPELALRLYGYFCATARDRGIKVETGIFQAAMRLYLVNDGPVTLILDSGQGRITC